MTALSSLLRSWTFRWAVLYLLISVAASGAVLGYLFWRTNDLLTDQTLQTLASEVTGLREQFRLGGRGLLRESVAERAQAAGNGIYLLIDPSGRKLAGNLSRVPPELSDPRGGTFVYRVPGAGTDPVVEQHVGVGIPIRVPGGYLLVVGRDVQAQHNFIASSRRILIWGVVIVGLIGLTGGVLVSRNILAKIDAVTATSRTIMAGNLSERVPRSGSGDELDRLAENLNAMLERIEQLMTGMREVSDNIAHDLKTPLNRLRNRVETALLNSNDQTVHRSVLEDTIDEADGLIKTFNALLSIARLEAGAGGDNMETFDLAAVVRDVGELYEPVAEEQGGLVVVDVPESVSIHGERQLVGQAISNLIENSLKYGGSDADGGLRIEIGVAGDVAVPESSGHGEGRASGRWARVVVADNGPGIPQEDRVRVLKRFVRLEVSRSRPGSGLGLSLVQAVARLHEGWVSLEDNAPGLRVVLMLPLAPT